MRVLVEQLLALVVDEALHLDGLRDHRCDDAEEFLRAVVVAIGLELEVDAQRADRLAVEHDRHADEAELLLRQLGPLRRAVQEHRLAADLRHDDRLAALDDASGDAFAELVADAIAGAVEPVGGLDLELAGVFVEHDDGAADGAVMAAEDFEDAMEPGLEIDRAGQRLARIEQGGQAPDFAGGGFGRFGGGAGGAHEEYDSDNNVRLNVLEPHDCRSVLRQVRSSRRFSADRVEKPARATGTDRVRQMPAFETLDPELRGVLGKRIRELGLRLEGSPVEPYVRQLYKELERRGLHKFRPVCYLTDEWGCPDMQPVLGIPFYLADPNLGKLERAIDDLEDSREIMRYMRHEAGHVFNYAYRLYARADWIADVRPVRSPVSRQVPARAVQPQLRAPHGRVVRAEASRRRLRRNVRGVAHSGKRVEAPI